jgi:hypothetical protein
MFLAPLFTAVDSGCLYDCPRIAKGAGRGNLHGVKREHGGCGGEKT